MRGINLSSFMGRGANTRGTIVARTDGKGIQKATRLRAKIESVTAQEDTLETLEKKIEAVVRETQGN